MGVGGVAVTGPPVTKRTQLDWGEATKNWAGWTAESERKRRWEGGGDVGASACAGK